MQLFAANLPKSGISAGAEYRCQGHEDRKGSSQQVLSFHELAQGGRRCDLLSLFAVVEFGEGGRLMEMDAGCEEFTARGLLLC